MGKIVHDEPCRALANQNANLSGVITDVWVLAGPSRDVRPRLGSTAAEDWEALIL